MDLLEHEGKRLFAAAGLPVLPSLLATTPEEARRAAGQLGPHVCVKAQVRTGGRGKAGGVRVCGSADEVEGAAAEGANSGSRHRRRSTSSRSGR